MPLPPQWIRIVEAEQEPAIKDYCVTEYDSTTIPETVPYNGGSYKLGFTTSIETRAADPIFVEWQYRVTLGDKVGDPVAVTERTESIDVEIAGNYTENERNIVVEMADAGAEPQWTKIVEARQEAALVLTAGFYWAKGNVTLMDGKFAVADKMSDLGLYFRQGSKYGVPSDGGSYAGTAYTPEAVQVALADIPYRQPNTDPCTMIDAGLRTPTYMELFCLYDREDYMNQHVLDGITGMGYLSSDYFMPFCGALELASGQISGKSQFGGYWGLGANYAGEGVIYVLNADYSMVDYDLAGTNMASLRCVKNIRQPSYVSHTPASVTDNASFKLTVKTDPGEFPAYEVDIEAEDGEIRSIDASPSETEVTLTVPKNDEVENREWRLFINRVYSGVSFVQPGKKNYVDYISHSPSKATYEAFTLSVKCESDLASFPVVIKGSDGLELTQNGSKENPTVSFSVPENSGEERTLAILGQRLRYRKERPAGGQPRDERLLGDLERRLPDCRRRSLYLCGTQGARYVLQVEEQVRHQVRRHGFEFDEISGCGLRTRRTVYSELCGRPLRRCGPVFARGACRNVAYAHFGAASRTCRRRIERIRALCVQNVQRRHAEYLHGAFRTVVQGRYEDHAAEYHLSMDGR